MNKETRTGTFHTYYGDTSGITERITPRDWFAGMALQGFLACDPSHAEGRYEEDILAESCFKIADAMLKERSK